MDYQTLATSVSGLVESGDLTTAYTRIRAFEARATGVELGLCLGLRAAVTRQLSPANRLESLGLMEESLPLLEGAPPARLVALVNVLQLCAEVGDPSRGLAWAEDFARVTADLEPAAATLPWIGRGYAVIASLLVQARNPEVAAEFFRRAAAIFTQLRGDRALAGREVSARMGLADIYLAAGQYLEAECECRTLLTMDLAGEARAEVLVRLAQIAVRTGRFLEAERWLVQAAPDTDGRGTPGAVRWLLARGELAGRRGQHGLARNYRRIAARMAADLRHDDLLHQATLNRN